MNIFVTDKDPLKSAMFLDDKRVVKMVLETAQMLSTAIHLSTDYEYKKEIYKPTHANHPCSLWARESKQNFEWLYYHFMALNHEYYMRFKKTHKSYSLSDYFAACINLFSDTGQTPFANCAANAGLNISFKHIEDVHTAYRLYLTERWKHDKRKPTWYGKERT